MNCSEIQQVLPELIEGSENHNIEYQAHLNTCTDCSELVSDLALIASESRQLAEVDEPPQRVWVKIAAELRAEGIIREAEVAPARPVLVPAAGRRWNAWWLVPVAAALVAVGSYTIKPKPAGPVARVEVPATVSNPSNSSAPAQSPISKPQEIQTQAVTASAKPAKSSDTIGPDDHAPMTMASTDQQFLDGVAPEMRPAYESQLKAVNSYIHAAESYLKQNPGDEDARQHLIDAYEQKAMLYEMALDHVQ
jgi:hypothetical protein